MGPIAVTRSTAQEYIDRLPRRELGPVRVVLSILLMLICVMTCLLISWLSKSGIRWGFHIGMLRQAGTNLVLITLICRYPLWLILFLVLGHRELRFTPHDRQSGDDVGSFGWNTRWPIARIQQLQIMDVGSAIPQGIVAGPDLRQFDFHIGRLDDDKIIIVVPGCPKSMLQPLIEHVQTQLSCLYAANAAKVNRDQSEN